ncbi:MAG: cobalamin biosynthesis protein [Proteobacteria bacterium]|nr:cobalamin biosynthesis protein [Pseudomonadota bacterium]
MDNPWWVGLAPLLGWCLDAVINTRRWEPLLPRLVQRGGERLEFVMRTGLAGKPERAGLILAAWLLGGTWVIGWGITQTAWVFGEGAPGKFVVWVILFFLLFGTRRRSAAGGDVMRSLLAENADVAGQWLHHIEGEPVDGSPQAIARATVHRMSESVVEKALLVTFWGVTLGMGVALMAACVHELAGHSRRSDSPDDPLWKYTLKAEYWLTLPAAWFSVIVVYLVIPLAGGSRARAMAGFLNHKGSAPLRRIALGVESGLGVTQTQTVEQKVVDPIAPEDIQRSVIILWTASFVGVAAMSGITALVFRFIGG